MEVVGRIKDVDLGTKSVVITNEEESKFFVKDKNVLRLLYLGLERKAKLWVEGNTVVDANVTVESLVRGVRLKDLKANTNLEIRKLYRLEFIEGLEILLEFDVIGLVLLVFALVLLGIYLLVIYPIVLGLASILTLGETWRMRHKYSVETRLDAKRFGEYIRMINFVLSRKGIVEGRHLDLTTNRFRVRINELKRSFQFLDLGKYIIGTLLIILSIIAFGYYIGGEIVLFIQTIKRFDVGVPILGIFGIGFSLMVYAGFLHRMIEAPKLELVP